MATMWQAMERYNLPYPGAKFIPSSHLDTYVTPGKVYTAEWGMERGSPSDVYLQSEHGGVGIRCWQFEGCEWEYFYPKDDANKLIWPRAPFIKRAERN